jgi:hypothetical protein
LLRQPHGFEGFALLEEDLSAYRLEHDDPADEQRPALS